MKIEYCPNCFGAAYQAGNCPQCGYRLQNDKNLSARSLPAGSVLNNRYYVGRVLGAGGFGITYKAYDTARQQICCIKEYAPSEYCSRISDGHSLVLLGRELEEPYLAALRRFIEEAQILSTLDWLPSVVKIYDTFRENNTAYFTMEFLDGSNLRQIIQSDRIRLTFQQATNIILSVALSLDVIHTRTGIIHRDISPENIIITNDGRVKLIDFGSAKRTEGVAKEGFSLVLKPKYAPPEQFSVTMAQGTFTDVYALAGTYYYTLTRQHLPVATDRVMGSAYAPLKSLNLGVPDGVSDAVDRALILNSSRRTQTMQAFLAEMAAALPQQNQAKKSGKNLEPPAPSGAGTPYIQVVSAGSQNGKRMELPPGQMITVGRSREAVFQINYSDISRIHCKVAYNAETGQFVIEDQSMNGVFYQGFRLKKGTAYQVKGPVRFVLANATCVVELGLACSAAAISLKGRRTCGGEELV